MASATALGVTPPMPEAPSPSLLTVLEVEIGDKVDIDPSHREWTKPFYVADATESTVWTVPFDEDWTTRIVTVEQGLPENNPRYDLVAGPDSIRIFGAIKGLERHHIGDVESIEIVGEVSTSKRVQLLGAARDAGAHPTPGDETYRRYYSQGGEEA